MDHILDSVLLSTVEDEDRFRTIIDQLIMDKEVKKFKVSVLFFYFPPIYVVLELLWYKRYILIHQYKP